MATVHPKVINRLRLKPDQANILKAAFARTELPSPQELDQLSTEVTLTAKWIKGWFYRQRLRKKKKSEKNGKEPPNTTALPTIKAEVQDPVLPSSPASQHAQLSSSPAPLDSVQVYAQTEQSQDNSLPASALLSAAEISGIIKDGPPQITAELPGDFLRLPPLAPSFQDAGPAPFVSAPMYSFQPQDMFSSLSSQPSLNFYEPSPFVTQPSDFSTDNHFSHFLGRMQDEPNQPTFQPSNLYEPKDLDALDFNNPQDTNALELIIDSLDPNLAPHDPFQAAIGLVLLSRLGFRWDQY